MLVDLFIRCRSAPLTSVAQWLSGLFGNADLTPSDLVAALVLTAAAQHQRRRLHIQNALEPVADQLSGLSLSEVNSDQNLGAQPSTMPASICMPF